MSAADAALERTSGWWNKVLVALANSLEGKIPGDWRTIVVEKFDSDAIHAQLLKTPEQWTAVAHQWKELNVAYEGIKQHTKKTIFTLNNFSVINTAVKRALEEARKFVTAIGTVDFILNVLPKAAKNRRNALPNDILDKIDAENLNAFVPNSLLVWLNAETKKSGGRLKKKDARDA